MASKMYHGAGRITCYCLFFFLIILTAHCGSSNQTSISVFSSSRDGDRMTGKADINFVEDKLPEMPVIMIEDGTQYQKIDGFGATFNEAGMICLNSLIPERQDSVFKMLFDRESGAGFSLMKAPIAACDYASAGPWYTYNDTPGDTAMIHFTVERDLGPNGMITYIRKAQQYGKFEIESPMDFAPDWMYFGLKKGEKHIKPEYYRALAKYYSKYIQAYASNGITINYLNLFNEGDNPHYSNVTYEEMGEMIKNYVVPQLKADGLPVKIQLGETCTRTEGAEKFPPVLNDPEVRKYVSTMTVHGYDWDQFSKVEELHNAFPDIPVWMTEVCYGMIMCIPPSGFVKCPVHEFSDGEFWGNMIMNDVKSWISGWIYWNMILDQDGGPWLTSPVHGDPDMNQQHSAVIIDRNTKKVTFTGLYYYLSHFSRFVRPGAYRIKTEGGVETLNFAGFLNPDGTLVLNVINNGNDTGCKISWHNMVAVQKFKAHSITTLKWNSVTIQK